MTDAEKRSVAGVFFALLASLSLGGCALPIVPRALSGAGVAAFPGAEGAGRLSLGGRGGRVLKVTNLNDAGDGSLRAAIEADGPRTILFDVAGTIALKSPLRIEHGRVTVAGQSAPGGGITLRDQTFSIDADDVVVRYIRSRLGDESHVEDDAMSIDGGRRIILDHVSASWSTDETLSASAHYDAAGAGIYDLTVQWSIISESLDRSIHRKGRHGYGSLIRGGEGSRFSWHHNLWADHQARVPRPGNYANGDTDAKGAFIDFRDNVFYNWGGDPEANQDATGWLKGTGRIDAFAPGYDADERAHVTVNFIDNAYVSGQDSRARLMFNEHNQLARTYLSGNSMNGRVPADQWSLVKGDLPEGYKLDAPALIGPVTTEPAESAYQRVLERAGASRARDAVDYRIVEQVRTRTGHIIDSQRDVGGWPTLATGTPQTDTDGDGMPDAWEKAHDLDPANAADGPLVTGDDYTNLELYLNSLVRS